MRINEILSEGKVIRVPMKSGGLSYLVVNPTKAQFQKFIRDYDDDCARCVISKTEFAMGDHFDWTHFGMCHHLGMPYNNDLNTGWATPEKLVIWGAADQDDSPPDVLQEEWLWEQNKALYEELSKHPIVIGIYGKTPTIAFTCNGGEMLLVGPNQNPRIIPIDIPLEN